MNIPITQSKMWQKLQDDLGETNFLETGKDYHYLAILKRTPVGNYLYLPYGPVAETKTALNKALESLKSLAKEKSAIFIRIEPRSPKISQYLPKNAKKTKDLNPKETWILDLTGNENDLKQKLPSRLLRYYRNAEKNGLKIEKTTNPEQIKELLKLQKSLAKEKGISTFSENYLKTELKQPFATLYLVKNAENKILAAGLVFDDETTRYNLQGAQSDDGKKLHATGILTIQLILDAKAAGKTVFDFWGIAPENAPKNHPWAGFTNFKKTFAGHEVNYLGTYDLVLNPIRYKIYQITRAIRRFL
ncbi:MAG: peptidoglycan bridge formation glycyltransferase FemA/FemB family protein [Candidatus Saccharibacteria bacterium]|nr:peptidoglycan bridge formation glycyltransferase FemA/FemB family protein [Candidatus Saccharibacteria bacterium]